MKTKLSIEESSRLIELGVDAKLASEIEYRPKKSGYGRNKYMVYSLADLLSILPKEIGNYELNISANKCEYFVSYILWDSMDDATYIRDVLSDDQFSAPELIDALYQLLIWCLTEKKINLNTDKK